jgi:PBP1b-binding outer membrane lipoprotein LpoB
MENTTMRMGTNRFALLALLALAAPGCNNPEHTPREEEAAKGDQIPAGATSTDSVTTGTAIDTTAPLETRDSAP